MNKLANVAPYLDDEKLLTNETYAQLYYRLERLALNQVRWYGLPEEVHQMDLEYYLFNFGRCAFFKDNVLDKYLVLPISAEFEWDEYGHPTKYEVHGFRDYRATLNIEDSVIIYNNYEGLPSSSMVRIFASRLTNTLRTGDVHLEAQKLGNIITVPETKQKGLREIIEKVKSHHLYIIASNAAAGLSDKITSLRNQPEYIVDRLDNHFTWLMHDALAYFGIESISDKKSGVNKIESMSEQSIASVNLQAILNPRRDACDKINAMFGLSVSVDPPEVETVDYIETDEHDVDEGSKLHEQLHDES